MIKPEPLKDIEVNYSENHKLILNGLKEFTRPLGLWINKNGLGEPYMYPDAEHPNCKCGIPLHLVDWDKDVPMEACKIDDGFKKLLGMFIDKILKEKDDKKHKQVEKLKEEIKLKLDIYDEKSVFDLIDKAFPDVIKKEDVKK